MGRGDKVVTQWPRHVLVYTVVLGVEDVASRAPCVVGKACRGVWGGCGVSLATGLSSCPPALYTTWTVEQPGPQLPISAPSSSQASWTEGGVPLTINAQHPFALVFWAGLKLLDDATAALKCHTLHLGRAGA
jgi:hypothetical protein